MSEDALKSAPTAGGDAGQNHLSRAQLHLPAPVTAVTLFEDRAEVDRVFSVAVPAGACTLVLTDLSPLFDDARLTARLVDPAPGVHLETLHIHRRLVSDARPDGARLAALHAAAEAAQLAVGEAERRLARAEERLGQARALLRLWLATAGRQPWSPGSVDRAASGLSADLDQLEAAEARIYAEREQARAALDAALDAQKAAVLEAAPPPPPSRQDLTAGPRVGGLRCTADLHLSLRAEAATAVRIGVSGVTPCALWRPAHEAELLADGTVRFTTGATVWQQTGEAWVGVQLTLSTDRPDRPARLPLLHEDPLRAQPRADRKRVVLAHRDEAIATDTGEAAVPGVDDGGEARVLRSATPVDVPADGRPRKVRTGGFTAPAQLRHLVRPEQARQVFLTAALRNAGAEPLLAGPVVMSRAGAYVGLGRVGFVGPGEPLELSFGADDRVRVKYTRERVDEHRRLLSDRTHFVQHVDLRYSGDDALALTVALRLPVSEVAALQVHASKAWCTEGVPEPDEDGIVSADLRLGDGHNRRISLGFYFETDGQVALPDPW